MPDDTQQHGAQHPLVGADGTRSWQFADGVYAWQAGNDVVLQGDDGDVTIPAQKLPILARALLAVHVANGRATFTGDKP